MIKKLAPLFATLCLLSGATVVQAGDTDIIGAPGIIPHPIESYLPITAERNSCLMCHKNAVAKDRKAGEIPLTHLKDGKITALSWDCVDKDGKLKSNLSMDGQYVMTEDGPKWHEQADAVVKYVLENQSLDGLINEDGYTDTVASVSINLYGFAGGVEDCLRQSSEGGTAAASVNAVKDGSYSYESPEFDGNGYKDQVAMTIQNGKITALTWDCVDKDGKKKSNLSMNGEYVMTEDGPKWHEQAEAVVAYVLENQSLDGLINEDGYTDPIASVSINLYGFTGGVEDCLKQASK